MVAMDGSSTPFAISRPEPTRLVADIGFSSSLAMEIATSLTAAAVPAEVNPSPRTDRILSASGMSSDDIAGLVGQDVEVASWTVVGAERALHDDDISRITETLAGAAPAGSRDAVRRLLADWIPGVVHEWSQHKLREELDGAIARARTRLPESEEATVADIITSVTGLRPLPMHLREIGRFPGARIVFVPSHFMDPSSGYLYGPERCLVMFSSRRGYAEHLQAAKRAPVATAEAAEAFVGGLKALADPMRLKIIGLLGERSMYTSELANALGLTQPAISHHISVLRAAGLVRVARSGPYVFAHVVESRLSELAASVSALIRSAGPDRSDG